MAKRSDLLHWQALFSLATMMLIPACTPAAIHARGESPVKATIQPSETATVATPPPVEITTASDTPEPCVQARGQIVEDHYTLFDGSSTVDVIVYLPPCYDDSGEDYPVAYFLHGYPQDERHWIELGVVERYEALLAGEQIDPLVMILVYQPEPYFTQTDGGPNSLEELLLERVLPQMDARYQLSGQPSRRAILGVSRGGVWALEISMRHPEQFDVVAALSPALAYNHPRRAYDPFEIARSSDQVPGHILLSAGDREPQFSDEIDRFAVVLAREDTAFQYLRHEGRHEDAAWRSIMDQVLIFLGDAFRD